MPTTSAILSAVDFARDAAHDRAIDEAIAAGKGVYGTDFYVVVVADLGNAATAASLAAEYGVPRADEPAAAYVGAVRSADVTVSIVDESGAAFSPTFPTDVDRAVVLVLKDDAAVAFEHTTIAAEGRAERKAHAAYVAAVADREIEAAEEAALLFSGTPDYGSDVSTFRLNPDGVLDLDSNFVAFDGTRVVAEAIARRLITPRGSLAYDPDFGLDVRAWVNAALPDSGAETRTGSEVFAIRAAVEGECLKDERVSSAVADVVHDRATKTITVRVMLELVTDAAFRLVLAIDSVTAAILKVTS